MAVFQNTLATATNYYKDFWQELLEENPNV